MDSRFTEARTASLATVRADGRPHLVPVVFACSAEFVYTPVDGKPKSGKPLLRLANIAHEPRVGLLADGYAEDWSLLWWVRVDGEATAHSGDAVTAEAHTLLRAKYPQYGEVDLGSSVIAVRVTRVASWSANG
ncbi:TIGR03668 family PPOX class F420-dependent oxidoreductase [Sciscionella marina]|uniref:TIGR03668 family PPOX class F420-dependent oxidoreductase n=1 Tax=Sciscionella marina TaxID=508770 RepID=UPI000360EAFF|nr:TIGR03668 family PPOX class F420-dependent oxidoreductase [Sciscionella marina]